MFQYDWDDANRNHIALHHVSTEEVEEVLDAHPLEVDFYERNGEDRLEEVGSTAAGRILHIVTTIRNGKLRVFTAFEATRILKLRFLEHQRGFYE